MEIFLDMCIYYKSKILTEVEEEMICSSEAVQGWFGALVPKLVGQLVPREFAGPRRGCVAEKQRKG